MISAGRYVSFCAVFVFGFGLIFELPLVLALLSYLRVVNAALLTRNRKYAILLVAVISAVVTPTPDVFNMGLMGVPMYFLFEIGVILVKVIEGKRARDQGSLLPKIEMDPVKPAPITLPAIRWIRFLLYQRIPQIGLKTKITFLIIFIVAGVLLLASYLDYHFAKKDQIDLSFNRITLIAKQIDASIPDRAIQEDLPRHPG